MGKTRRNTKKRKNTVDDVEPEFVCTVEEQTDGGEPEDTQHQHTPLDETQPQNILDASEGDKAGTEQEPDKESQSYPAVSEETTDTVQPQPKKHRGPTKMKDIAKDPNTRIGVEFTELGEPCGEGSVKLSSYLVPLVREHVPVLIDDWRKIGEERKTVLWKFVKVIYQVLLFYNLLSGSQSVVISSEVIVDKV